MGRFRFGGWPDPRLYRHHHAAQKALPEGPWSAVHSPPARGPRGGVRGVPAPLLPTGPAYTCLEAATGRALLRQHMDITGEDHPLNKLRVRIEPGQRPPTPLAPVPRREGAPEALPAAPASSELLRVALLVRVPVLGQLSPLGFVEQSRLSLQRA